MTTFNKLGLSANLMKGLDDLGFSEPSEIQGEAIPFILSNKSDLIALAQTGTGKTAAFSLPILEKINPNKKELQAIVICPTRELCLQISEDINNFAKYIKGVDTVSVYGGERIDLQIRKLKKGANIVVGTPGRLHDLVRRNVLKLDKIQYLVLDEADEMLDMGFKEDLDAILEGTPETRQTLLFSATISTSVRRIAKQYMKEAEEIKVGEENIGAKNVTHEYYIVGGRDRYEALERIIDSLNDVYGIVFCRTRIETQLVADKLKQSGYDAEALHGEITQNTRTKIMARFKKKNISLLVATDVAARGIDVNDLTHVINYNLPDQSEAYTHRSGRTGRAGSSGVSIAITGTKDRSRIRQLEKMIGKGFEYKKVPNGEEILNNKLASYIKKINKDVDELAENTYFDGVVDSLKKIKKEDLIKFIMNEKFSRFIGNRSAERDLNAKMTKSKERFDDKGKTNIRFSVGKKNGADVKALFGLINSNKKTKGMEIGRVVINPTYSMVSVREEDAKKVVSSFKNERFRGTVVKAEISNEPIEKSTRGRRGGRSRSAYKGKTKRTRKRY